MNDFMKTFLLLWTPACFSLNFPRTYLTGEGWVIPPCQRDNCALRISHRYFFFVVFRLRQNDSLLQHLWKRCSAFISTKSRKIHFICYVATVHLHTGIIFYFKISERKFNYISLILIGKTKAKFPLFSNKMTIVLNWESLEEVNCERFYRIPHVSKIRMNQ